MSKHHQTAGDARQQASQEGSPKPGQNEEGVGPADASNMEANASPSPEGPATDLEARCAALQEEVSSLKDQYLRKLADYENFRKRMFREKDEAIQYANSSLLVDLIGVVDDFDRASKSADEHGHDYKALHDGVQMIRTRLLGTLEGKYGLKRFDSAGLLFDPNLHEAVATEPGDCEEPTVGEEYLSGYRLHDRVVRSAKVKVLMPKNPATAGAESNPADGSDER